MPISQDQAADLLDVKPKDLSRFDDAPDLFNDPNRLSGWLCRRADHRYGALVIDAVNPCSQTVGPQIIYGTPKVRYPFGKTEADERIYHWPATIRRAVAFEKYDGTNILAYSYTDGESRFVTYKTRLTPTLRGASTHGDFAELWSEVLTSPGLATIIRRLVVHAEINLSFELYGYRNHHLVSYREAIAAVLLFGVGACTFRIIPPGMVCDDLPPARIVAECKSRDQLTEFYELIRAESENQNKALDDDHLEGTEGAVIYLEDEPGAWSQWKCKPESVEALHWVGDYIPMSRILPTVWNALEHVELDALGFTTVGELLAEEFTDAMIRNSTRRIAKAINRVVTRVKWQGLVKRAYVSSGTTFSTDGKGGVMRALSAVFERSRMRDVYNALRELGLT